MLVNNARVAMTNIELKQEICSDSEMGKYWFEVNDEK